MKITEIDIKEFGGLKDFKKTFESGANMIFEPGGFGKSTVASFIKAMLYGFPAYSGADVNRNLRLKMTPWSGNDFGGTMTVETDEGKKYRIERIFSAKGYTDTVYAYDAETGEIETELLPYPGERLLKVGGENFDRCVYTPQNRIKTDNDVSLTARLGRALEEHGGGASLEKAAGVLNESLEGLAGEEGRLKKITAEIDKVKKQIKAADAKRARQLSDVKRRADLKAKIVKYEAEIELLKSNTIPQVEINKTAALYQKIERQKQDKQRQIEAMKGHLTGYRLTDGEKEELQGYLDRIKELDEVAAAGRTEGEEAKDNKETSGKESEALKDGLKKKKLGWLRFFTKKPEKEVLQPVVSCQEIAAPPAAEEPEYLHERALSAEKALLLGALIFKGADSTEKLERFMLTYESDLAALETAKKDINDFDDTLSEIKAGLKDTDDELLARKFTEDDFDVKIPQKRLKYLETSVKNMIAEVGHIEGAAAAGAETPIPRAALKQLYNNLVKDRDEMEYVIYCIDSAVYHLGEGREQLLNNYAPPLKANMAGYMQELSFAGEGRATVDSDLNISIVEDGAPRDLGYFSQGLQDLGYFALRMAMLDLIYKTEKPFVVLDEPFVNFDDRHMEMARALIKKIAADKQVIYMTSQEAHRI